MTFPLGSIDAFMGATLVHGLWWLLPLLAATCMAGRKGMLAGDWARWARVGLKVKTACIFFKLPLEARKAQAIIVNHMLAVAPLTRANFKSPALRMMKEMSLLFKLARFSVGVTLGIAKSLHILTIPTDTIIFHLVQVACILVENGMGDSWVFQLFSIRMDLIIHSVYARSNNKKRKFTFGAVMNEVLSHPEMRGRFLGSPVNHIRAVDDHAWKQLPLYSRLRELFNNMDDATRAEWANRMPKCVIACMAYVKFTRFALLHPRRNSNLRFQYAAFKSYIKSQSVDEGVWFVEKRTHIIFGDRTVFRFRHTHPDVDIVEEDM